MLTSEKQLIADLITCDTFDLAFYVFKNRYFFKEDVDRFYKEYFEGKIPYLFFKGIVINNARFKLNDVEALCDYMPLCFPGDIIMLDFGLPHSYLCCFTEVDEVVVLL